MPRGGSNPRPNHLLRCTEKHQPYARLRRPLLLRPCAYDTNYAYAGNITSILILIVFNASGQQYRQITSFIYLGGAVTESPTLDLEVNRSIRAGWMSFNRYGRELYDRSHGRKSADGEIRGGRSSQQRQKCLQRVWEELSLQAVQQCSTTVAQFLGRVNQVSKEFVLQVARCRSTGGSHFRRLVLPGTLLGLPRCLCCGGRLDSDADLE